MAKKKKGDWTTVNLIILGLGLMMYVNKKKASENPFAAWADYPYAKKTSDALWSVTMKSGSIVQMNTELLDKMLRNKDTAYEIKTWKQIK